MIAGRILRRKPQNPDWVTLTLVPGWDTSEESPLRVRFESSNSIRILGDATPDHDPVEGEHIASRLPKEMWPWKRYGPVSIKTRDFETWTVGSLGFSVETDGRMLWYPPS